ncbi:sensor histidine kinase [Micromonospora sp. NPDC003776]
MGKLISVRTLAVKDLGLAAFALLLQSVPFLFSMRHPGQPWTLAQYVPTLFTTLPLLWRRHAPFACFLVIVLGIEAYAVVGREGPSQSVWYGGLIAIYTVGELARRPARIAALAIIPVGVVVAVGSISTGVRETLTWGAAYALGATVRTRRVFTAESSRKSTELALERERVRIARDLHDILGHAFSVMVVQAEAGAMTSEAGSAAKPVFQAISATGRDAMAQLRTTIGKLRAAGPLLADLPDLVRRAAPSGVRVGMTVHGEPRELPHRVQTVGYRVVQEALTNSLKHAEATTVEVAVRWDRDEVRLTVTDDGTGSDVPTGGEGAGLAGMRARVAEVGGAVRFGPRRDGRGFVVEAVLA